MGAALRKLVTVWMLGVLVAPFAFAQTVSETGEAVAMAAPTKVEKHDLSLTYDLYLAGLNVAEASVRADLGASTYRARSSLKTNGLISLFLRSHLQATVEGERDAQGRFRPISFESVIDSSGNDKGIRIEYDDNAPRQVTYTPPAKRRPYDIEPTQQLGTIDPMTAALVALSPMIRDRICDRMIPVYDGRRRYNLIFKSPEADIPPPIAPRPGTKIVHCEGFYERVAGFKPKHMTGRLAFPFDIWFEVEDAGPVRALRASGQTNFGPAHAILRR